jgi:4-hydroxybenzoate polyprenyl transferase
MWPCWFGVIIASDFNSSIYIWWLLIFFIGSVLLRSVGCIINDIWDREIDAKVERTKNRPIASGKISVKSAICFLISLLLPGAAVFWTLSNSGRLISIVAFLLAIIYPLVKRFSNLPQLFLGITFNLGVLISYYTVIYYIEGAESSYSIVYAYIGCVFWTLAYDTIYGHQDKKDDQKIGVKSTSQFFGKYNKLIILICYFLFIAGVSASAYFAGMENIYYFTIAPFAYLVFQVYKVDLDDKNDCMDKFKDNAYVAGALVFLALAFSKIISVDESSSLIFGSLIN